MPTTAPDCSTGTNIISAAIASNTTWVRARPIWSRRPSPSIAGVTLTILSGTTVKFNGNLGLTVNGSLVVSGTASSHVRFMGATNTPGAWSDVILSNSSIPSQISYADFLYGGSASAGAIDVTTGTHVLSNIQVLYASNVGVRVDGGNPTFSGLNITNASTYGLYVTSGSPSFTNINVSQHRQLRRVRAGWHGGLRQRQHQQHHELWHLRISHRRRLRHADV